MVRHGAAAWKVPVAGLSALVVALGCAAARGETARPVPTPIGTGARFQPPPGAHPVRGLTCSSRSTERVGVHVELFAQRRVVLVPAGIGVAAPHRRRGAYVLGGRCSYPARTVEPTGVIEVARTARLTLGQFFDLWGQPLSATRLVGFRARPGERLQAFVGGRPWSGDPRGIPLRRHAQIVLEIGGFVPPHSSYLFRPGL